MDFLLECIGIPPDHSREALVELLLERGESVAWRGGLLDERRLPLAGGLELRLERGPGAHWTLWPYYAETRRLRVAVSSLRTIPDSPFNVLLSGWAAPPIPEWSEPGDPPGEYFFSSYLTDARRLEPPPEPGHVLAISTAGFALDITYVGPNEGGEHVSARERSGGALIQPLGGAEAPGGCNDLSVRVRSLRHVRNPITGIDVEIIEADAPERPLTLFLSRWQLEQDDLPSPRPGWRIEGTFLFSGRIAGGLPGPRSRADSAFG